MPTNKERSEATKRVLIQAANELFSIYGFAGTNTPQITEAAKLSRGALYHHFKDKAGLLKAVIEEQLKELARIVDSSPRRDDPIEDLISAGEAYLDAMRDEGRVRLLFIEGPAVLGPETMRELDQAHGVRTLSEGVARAAAEGAIEAVDVGAMADLLSALYETAAVNGTVEHRQALRALIEGLRTGIPRPVSGHPRSESNELEARD